MYRLIHGINGYREITLAFNIIVETIKIFDEEMESMQEGTLFKKYAV